MQIFKLFEETFTQASFDFLKTTEMQTVWEPKHVTLEFLAENVSHVVIVTKTPNFKNFKDYLKKFLWRRFLI